ncbi:MAG: hypothetical protein KZQ93_00140 [Candidatus Thiodiazotropha sp. (ex Monitilora ramsayi)]|nr:hypothetical protein [Candidatus Thiodiazotropha sp. (ex Monitilora ramsayi)]
MSALVRIGWVVVISVLFLSGCGTATHSYLIKKDLTIDNVVTTAKLEIVIDNEKFFSVSENRSPGERAALATSMTSAYQNTPPPQGASPGGMAAAFVLATYLAKASADSVMLSKSNKKAQKLLDIINQDEHHQKIEESIAQQLHSLRSIQIISHDKKSEACCDGQVNVSPQLRLSNNLRILEVKIDYTITNHRNNESIYSNSFIYQSDPAPSVNSIDYWVEDEASPFFSTLNSALEEIVKLIDYEFTSDPNNKKISTIKYKNGWRNYYERGTLLWNTDQRIILRDLRGNVRSFNGKLL